jgi:N-sulfoglucosamine sulfohydrolase
MISLLDIFPTFCDLLAIQKPPWLQGNSIVPLLEHKVQEIRDAVFAEINFHAAYQPMRAIRTARYKYIRTYGELLPTPANIDEGICKQMFIRSGYLEQEVEAEMLFDLLLDPQECRNLAASRRHEVVKAELAARLDGWMEETGDPLLTGPVPIPPAAIVNRRDCLSADEMVYEVDHGSP